MFIWIRSLGALVVAVSVLLAAPTVTAGDGGVPLPTVTKGKGEQCVDKPEIMRREHMDFLKHQRDDTMYDGIRTKLHSLKECIECHVQRTASGETIPVTDEGQFCQSCHEYAAVSMDCFQCHATTPDSGAKGQGR